MVSISNSLKEVLEWKDEAYKEVQSCNSLKEKIEQRLKIINDNVKEPVKLEK